MDIKTSTVLTELSCITIATVLALDRSRITSRLTLECLQYVTEAVKVNVCKKSKRIDWQRGLRVFVINTRSCSSNNITLPMITGSITYSNLNFIERIGFCLILDIYQICQELNKILFKIFNQPSQKGSGKPEISANIRSKSHAVSGREHARSKYLVLRWRKNRTWNSSCNIYVEICVMIIIL